MSRPTWHVSLNVDGEESFWNLSRQGMQEGQVSLGTGTRVLVQLHVLCRRSTLSTAFSPASEMLG